MATKDTPSHPLFAALYDPLTKFVEARLLQEHREYLAETLDRMETRIDDGLRLARAGETVGEADTVEPAELLDGCWRDVDTHSVALLAETDATIRADETRLQQLIEILFRNTVEHGGDDVTFRGWDLDDGFYIEGDGQGIPDEDREQVFETGYS